MNTIWGVELYSGSKEERLPGFVPEFPYIVSHVIMDKNRAVPIPWHFHAPVELFYMEKGSLEYCTPGKKMVFPPGSGGLVNSGVLHMTRTLTDEKCEQYLHIFSPSLIAGKNERLMEQKYVSPIIEASWVEILPLFPNNPAHARALMLLKQSFCLSEQEFGYELKLRALLSEIWMEFLKVSSDTLKEKGNYDKTNDKVKSMMAYIHEHYAEKITVSDLAAASFISDRECFRVFKDCLHMTPVEYMNSYRLQQACRMLEEGRERITDIAHACCLGSSSYFGKLFKSYVGCTPAEYRRGYLQNKKEVPEMAE